MALETLRRTQTYETGLFELRRRYGRKLVLIGGVCNTRLLPRNNHREIEAHLRPLRELAQTGGAVLGMASVPAEMPSAAYDYAMQLLDAVNA